MCPIRRPEGHCHPTMAKSISLVISEDLDGSEGTETVNFGVDGVTYETDLSEKNRAKLDKAFASFIEHGRRVTQRQRRAETGLSNSRVDRAAVRAWAKGNGLKISGRGRISAEVLKQYGAAD